MIPALPVAPPPKRRAGQGNDAKGTDTREKEPLPLMEEVAQRSLVLRAWSRTKRIVIDRILGLHDTPHRIAFGVFLGFLIGWSPTMGLQIFFYLVAASILRANCISGIPPILLTNPLTAFPIYVFNWRIGRWLLNSAGGNADAAAEAMERERLDRFFEEFSIRNMFDGDYWTDLGPSLKALGIELLFGCFIVGLACGILGYIATYYGVLAYRRRKGHLHDHPANINSSMPSV